MARSKRIISNIDWPVVIIYLILVFLGWINIYSAVFNEESQNIFDFSQRYGKQLVWIIAAIIIALTILIIETKFYVFFSYLIYGILLFLLFLVLLVGDEIHGSRSWFVVGGLSFQPSEFMKFATGLALAKYINHYNFNIRKFKSVFYLLLFICIPMGLIFFQNDTGSSLVYFSFILVLFREGLSALVLFFLFLFGILSILSLVISNMALYIMLIITAFIVFYFFHQKFRLIWKGIVFFLILSGAFFLFNEVLKFGIETEYIILISSIFSSLIFLIIAIRKKMKNLIMILLFFIGSVIYTISVDYVFNNVFSPHQQSRINELLGIESDPLGAGYNVNQSKIAIGSGGFFGKGFLNGTQTKFDFVPEQSTDFIFCTVGEEWGFLGSLIVIGLFMLLFYRLILLSERQRSTFSRVYGYSVTVILFFHFAVNIGMTIGLMPVIGIPLPFISYGGSSLWSFTILIFIFLKLDADRLKLFV